ncbi:PucR family transcriptional regulator [Streptomyces sp. NPDC055709]
MVTLAEVLEMDVIKCGAPLVMAGRQGLTRPVRWVTAPGALASSRTLRRNDLVVSTRDDFPNDADALRAIVRSLAEAEVSGLIVLSGDRHAVTLPDCVVRSAEQRRLPLVACGRTAGAGEVAEAVDRAIFSRQLHLLAALDHVHRTFDELSLEGASTWQVVQHMAASARRPVVLEDLSHRMLAYETAGYTRDILTGWEETSRRIRTDGRVFYDAETGWMSSAVGARGSDWGRVLMLAPRGDRRGSSHSEEDVLIATLERGAAALALNQMTGHVHFGLERRAHAELLGGILAHSLTHGEVALRARAMGVPLDLGPLAGLAVRHGPAAVPGQGTDLRQLAETAQGVLRAQKLKGIVAPVDGSVAVLLSLGTRGEQVLEAVTASLRHAHRRLPDTGEPHPGPGGELIIAAGPQVRSVSEARATLSQAIRIAATAHRMPEKSTRRPLHLPLRDLGVGGLLDELRDDRRLQSYVEQEIGPLLEHDARRGTDLTAVLAAYLRCGRNKTAAAEAAHMSRPSFYDRLDRIERILSADLDDPQSCFSLHVAVQALEAMRPPGSGEELRGEP